MSNEKHNPEPDEIRRECLKIQATWSRAEERKRRVVAPEPVTAEILPTETFYGEVAAFASVRLGNFPSRSELSAITRYGLVVDPNMLSNLPSDRHE